MTLIEKIQAALERAGLGIETAWEYTAHEVEDHDKLVYICDNQEKAIVPAQIALDYLEALPDTGDYEADDHVVNELWQFLTANEVDVEVE